MNITSTGSTTAGRMFTLTCSIEGLPLRHPIVNFIWRISNRSILADSNELQIQSSNPFNSSLKFDSLYTSHGGNYTCETPYLTDGRNTSVVVHCMEL